MKHKCENCGAEYTNDWAAQSVYQYCPKCVDMMWDTADNEAFDCADGDDE